MPGIVIETLQRIADFSVIAFVVSSMLVMGMSQRLGDVVAPLKDPRMVTFALAVSFVAAPLLALLLSRAMLGSFAIGTYLLFVSVLVLLGYAVGGRDPRTRGVFALASGQRNIPAAVIVAVGGFREDPAVMVMVLMGAAVGLALLLGMARLLRSRLAKVDSF